MTITKKRKSKKEFGYTNRILGDVVSEEPTFGQSMRRKSLSDLEGIRRFLSNESRNKNPSTIKMKDFLNDNNRLVTENNFLKQTIKIY
jgi:hypothetical protein